MNEELMKAYDELNYVLSMALEVLQVSGHQQIVENVNTKKYQLMQVINLITEDKS